MHIEILELGNKIANPPVTDRCSTRDISDWNGPRRKNNQYRKRLWHGHIYSIPELELIQPSRSYYRLGRLVGATLLFSNNSRHWHATPPPRDGNMAPSLADSQTSFPLVPANATGTYLSTYYYDYLLQPPAASRFYNTGRVSISNRYG